PLDNNYSAHSFIANECNIQALETLSNWPQNWGVLPYPKTLILWGEINCGKTHLAHIWQEKNNAVFIADLHPDLFNLNLSECPIILEDIDRKLQNEQKILQIFNYCHENGIYLLLTSNQNPHLLPFTLPDLASRIKAIKSIQI